MELCENHIHTALAATHQLWLPQAGLDYRPKRVCQLSTKKNTLMGPALIEFTLKNSFQLMSITWGASFTDSAVLPWATFLNNLK